MSETLHSQTIDQTHDTGDSVDPKIEALAERFAVSNETATAINSLDKGSGIHAGGYVSDEERALGAATRIRPGTETWENLRDQYGASTLFNAVHHSSENSFSSNALSIPMGMSLEDARDMVVYGMTAGNKGVAERPTEVFTASNHFSGDPLIVLGTAAYNDHGQFKVLEVATGKDGDGNVIGFSVTRRDFDRTKDENFPRPPIR